VHFLLLDDVDIARRGVERLERLVVGAIEPRTRATAAPTDPEASGEGP
jgi:hypothetical protein